MKILVACEESQAVTIELRRLGHEAYSCDIEPCSGGFPEWHLQVDALELLKMRWDMLIAHPPCTFLTAAGAQRLHPHKGETDAARLEKGREAAKFFMAFYNADIPKIAVENPVPLTEFGLPKYSQIIQPYMFGEPYQKRTCLWLKGLPPLTPTDVVTPTAYWVQGQGKRGRGHPGGHRSPKLRSKTFQGIARAMAEQWAGPANPERSDSE